MYCYLELMYNNIRLENYNLLHISGTWAGILRQQKRFMGLLRPIPTDLLQEHQQDLQALMQERLMDKKNPLLPLSVIESKN